MSVFVSLSSTSEHPSGFIRLDKISNPDIFDLNLKIKKNNNCVSYRQFLPWVPRCCFLHTPKDESLSCDHEPPWGRVLHFDSASASYWTSFKKCGILGHTHMYTAIFLNGRSPPQFTLSCWNKTAAHANRAMTSSCIQMQRFSCLQRESTVTGVFEILVG